MRGPRRLPGELFSWFVAPLAEKIDRGAGWDRLPPGLGVATLLGIRHRLRVRNLYDTRRVPVSAPANGARPSPVRSRDGRGNDVADPDMGAAGTPFGRNAPPVVEPDDADPDPLAVSERLLTRDEFFPAETVNLLAAAWVQFEVHDWFAHRTEPYTSEELEEYRRNPDVPAPPQRLARDDIEGEPFQPFLSDQTHWWDASQLYGVSNDFEQAIRVFEGGRVKDDLDLLRAIEPYTTRRGGAGPAVPNMWLGTALFHVLFAKEHNAICDRLAADERQRDDEWLFQKARMINAAIMAKIHTVEWTPAIIAHPTTIRGAHAAWSGLLPIEPGGRWPRPFKADEVPTGIPGSRLSHDGAPYSLTEEFVTVYRMHQLIPDDVTFRSARNGAKIGRRDIADITIAHREPERPRKCLEVVGFPDAWYSLGIAFPGEITLHNYPRFLQEFKSIEDGVRLNLGMVDILRTRQTGVPRYNNFRRLFRLPPAATFHEVANGNPKWAKEIRDVYGDLEKVDLLIGMFAERKPKGFAFSDTAFRVFLLMAARRLRSDRFFTGDYTAGVYTRTGLDLIERASLSDMLARHFELGAALENVRNPFRPWPTPGTDRRAS
jgi:hypothetical protein